MLALMSRDTKKKRKCSHLSRFGFLLPPAKVHDDVPVPDEALDVGLQLAGVPQHEDAVVLGVAADRDAGVLVR